MTYGEKSYHLYMTIPTGAEQIAPDLHSTDGGSNASPSLVPTTFDDKSISIEQKVREREALLQTLGDNLPAGAIYQFVLEADGHHYYTHISNSIELLLGISATAILQNADVLITTYRAEDLIRVQAQIEAAIAALTLYEVELQRQLPDGTIRWIYERGQPRRLDDGSIVWDGIYLDTTVRKTTQAALERYQLLAQKTRDIILFMQPDTGLIVEANAAAVEAYGYSYAELLTLRIHDLRDPTTLPGIDQLLQHANASSLHYETRHRRADGSIFPVEINVCGADVDGKRVLLSIVRDVTARKMAEEALWQNHALLQSVINGTPNGIYVRDLQGRYLLVNRVGAEIVGLTPEAMLGQSYTQLFAPDVVASIVAQDRRTLESDQMQTEEIVWQHAGETATLHSIRLPYRDWQGNIVGILNVAHDITGRKRAEEALRASEARFRQLADAMPQIVWTCEADGTLTYINAQWRAYSGMTFAQSIDEGMWPALHPDDQAANRTQWRTALQNGTDYEAEVRLRRSDGDYRWFLERAVPIRDEAHVIQQWFGVSVDIDDRKRVEHDQGLLLALDNQIRPLADAKAMMRALVSTVGKHLDVAGCLFIEIDRVQDCAIVQCDWQNGESTLVGTYNLAGFITPTMQAVLMRGQAYQINDVTTDPSTIANAEEFHRLGISAMIIAPYIREGQWAGALVVHSPTARAWRAAEATLLETVVVRCWPTIEGAQVEAALWASEERLRLALESGGLGIWEWHIATDQSIWSDQEYALFGVTPGEPITPEFFASLVHPEDWPELQRILHEAAVRSADYTHEFRILHPDGSVRWLSERGVAICDEQGQPLRVLGINFEITERKLQEETLRQLNAQLEARVAERTATLGRINEELARSNRELEEFNYAAAHDLKSPLRGIQHLVQWLTEDAVAVLPASSQKHLAQLRRRVQRLDHLLDDMLAYSRIGRVQYAPETVALTVLINDIIELLAPPPGFTIEVPPALPTLVTLRIPLETILRNLLSNAIKHHHQPQQATVRVDARTVGDQMEFLISDDGPGIEPEFHERIFGMFQTLQPRDQVEGSGIGLALVKKTVESYGGAITLQSVVGQGTTFHFLWPI